MDCGASIHMRFLHIYSYSCTTQWNELRVHDDNFYQQVIYDIYNIVECITEDSKMQLAALIIHAP